jgi:1-deoxy-D-xylulose-5-phosphate reductoisomerase
LNLKEFSQLSFYPPDTDRFPSLKLAFNALEAGDGALVAINASNEVASKAFIEGKIKFTDIPIFIEETLEHHPRVPVIEDIETIWEIHKWAQKYTEKKLGKLYA